MTPEFFKNMMSKLDFAFPGNMVLSTEDYLQLWYDFLSFHDDEVLAVAVIRVIRTLKAFPSISHIEDFIRDAFSGNWEEAYEECRLKAHTLRYPELDRDGKPKEPDFKDHLALKTLRAIGHESFMQCPTDQLNTFRAQFRNIYEDMKRGKEMDDYKKLAVGGKDSPAMMLIEGRSEEFAVLVEKMRLNKPDDQSHVSAIGSVGRH